MARVVVNHEDIEKIKNLVGIFGTVRKNALIELINLYFECSEEAAKKILSTLLRREVIFQGKNKYTGWQIIKITRDKIVDVPAMDVFEAYVELYASIIEGLDEDIESKKRFIQAGKLAFPYDYIFAVNEKELYRVITFDESGYQKVTFATREEGQKHDDDILLIAITSKTEPPAEALKIDFKHRIALIRTQGKKVACKLTDIMEA